MRSPASRSSTIMQPTASILAFVALLGGLMLSVSASVVASEQNSPPSIRVANCQARLDEYSDTQDQVQLCDDIQEAYFCIYNVINGGLR